MFCRYIPTLMLRKLVPVVIALFVGLGAGAGAILMLPEAEANDQLVPVMQSARPNLGRTFISTSGITHTLSAITTTQLAFPNDGQTWIEVANAFTASQVITFETPGNVGGLPIGDLAVTIPATTTFKIGPFRPSLFNRTASVDKGQVYITFPGTTDITVGVFSINQ